jgi:UDP-GlcNAc:undecaprenyl-phosphate GlcNAc-1-phosphate transferase
MYQYLIVLLILFIIELLYFKLADRYNIIDKPNHRSSHVNITIRGGGIIFPIALLIYPIYGGSVYPWFLVGLAAISFISFIDDTRPLSNKLRIVVHLVAVALLFTELNVFVLPFYWVILAFVFVIGTINAINFMDGINGITGIYGFVTLASLYYINLTNEFTNPTFLLVAILSVVVFNFFNFRTKAKCFAGDVGSVSLAFIIVFFISQLILKTQNLAYILLLLIYGLDAFTTIVFRTIRKENILEAHRRHFYQFLANEKKVPHLIVSGIYGVSQLLINIAVLSFKSLSPGMLFISTTVSIVFFVGMRLYTEGAQRLIGNT